MVNISNFDASEYIENEEDAIAYLTPPRKPATRRFCRPPLAT